MPRAVSLRFRLTENQFFPLEMINDVRARLAIH
jgi:hypothetical protein